jgi:hypothetical protein
MATSKKSAAKIKKPARKIAKKVPVVQAAPAPAAVKEPKSDVPVDALGNIGKKRGRGRPPGSKSKTAKRGAGRPAATQFLYSLAQPAPVDDMGLPDNAPKKVEVIGPFNSEDAAIADAMAAIGAQSDIVVTLYRDYRTGTVEVKTRLV